MAELEVPKSMAQNGAACGVAVMDGARIVANGGPPRADPRMRAR
jgi:hypothetical protein